MARLLLILIYKAEEKKIQIGFQNDTEDQFVLEGEITFNGPKPIRLTGKLPANAKAIMGEIPFDQINDYPHFEMEMERHTSQGHAETIESKIKPKPKHFIKMSLLNAWNKRPGRSYTIWEESKGNSGLDEIPIPSRRSISRRPKSGGTGIIRDLSELAVFNRELDLHANKLFDDPGSVSSGAIYRKQMKTFQWYMEKAKSMDIDRVFIIHGVGTGQLKRDIANKLEYDPAVASYTNEHHPKYGFGATEVVFKNSQ